MRNNNFPSGITPDAVLSTRIFLAQNEVVTHHDLVEIGGTDLTNYLKSLSSMPSFDQLGFGPDWIACRSQDVAEVMRQDRRLVELYELGKARRNPSGRSMHVHRRGEKPRF